MFVGRGSGLAASWPIQHLYNSIHLLIHLTVINYGAKYQLFINEKDLMVDVYFWGVNISIHLRKFICIQFEAIKFLFEED